MCRINPNVSLLDQTSPLPRQKCEGTHTPNLIPQLKEFTAQGTGLGESRHTGGNRSGTHLRDGERCRLGREDWKQASASPQCPAALDLGLTPAAE